MICISGHLNAVEKKVTSANVKSNGVNRSVRPSSKKVVANTPAKTTAKKSVSASKPTPKKVNHQTIVAKKVMPKSTPVKKVITQTSKLPKSHQPQVKKPQVPADPNHLMSGETMVAFLERHGVGKVIAESIWKLPKAKQNLLVDVKPSHSIICYGAGANFKSCHIMLSDKVVINLIKLGDQIEIEQQAVSASKSLNYGEITVANSIFLDGQHKGYDTRLLSEVYGAVRALLQDQKLVRKGDRIEFIYEKKQLSHGIIALGRVVDVVYHGARKSFHISRFNGKDKGFYDEKGQLAALSFLRFPVKFSHISSKFSKGRKHPVYGIVKPHHGVDLAARMQTPIKATAAGRIIYANVKGGYGNTIMIQHNEQYKTLYAHMHHFAKTSKVGHYVRAGDIIGYVGSTGVSTGPHVHYEIRKNNVPIDPVNSVLPSLAKLDAKSLKQHQQEQAKWDMLRLSLTDSV